MIIKEIQIINRSKKGLKINQQIKSDEVRLIGSDGEQLGVVSIQEASNKADDAELDLVEISPNTNPPVCKILDYVFFVRDTLSVRDTSRDKCREQKPHVMVNINNKIISTKQK